MHFNVLCCIVITILVLISTHYDSEIHIINKMTLLKIINFIIL